jgi:hypothetical protein
MYNNHPHLTEIYTLFQSETHSFRKLHRMIDLFESLIKSNTVVIMGEYFRKNDFSDAAKGLLAAGLRALSLGTWQLFSRELFRELAEQGHAFTIPSFPKKFKALDKALNQQSTNVIAFRNRYAHGATPSDEECMDDIDIFKPFLKELYYAKWLCESRLEKLNGKVYIKVNESGEKLSLHPLMMYRPEEGFQPFAFFNDLKNKKVGLLNYPLCKHYREKAFYAKFHEHLPLDQRKESTGELFAQRIEELTETFKGRLPEREQIKAFITARQKGYLSVVGNPGIGKSALMAKALQELKADGKDTPIYLVEYFIRRGTAQAQASFLLEYLTRQTDAAYPKGRIIRPKGSTHWEVQQALFEKWRDFGYEQNAGKLVLLIDGLDEAGGTGLHSYLPRETFTNVLIIYASRPAGSPGLEQLWGELPVDHHEKMELGGLNRQDISALLYEVVNKYKLQESWIDELEVRSQGNPLYLKLLCNALEDGSIQINDPQSLPQKIEDYYKAILDRYASLPGGDDLLNSLFIFAAARDDLTASHIWLINSYGPATRQLVMSTLAEVLHENRVEQKTAAFRLFHESLRECLIKHCPQYVREAGQRIAGWCDDWDQTTGYKQRYALQHYASHLESFGSDAHLKHLLDLAADQSYQTAQKQALRSFEPTNRLLQLAMDAAYKLDDKEAILQNALRLVELGREESSDIQTIVEMVKNQEMEPALERITRFGDGTNKGYQRLFLIYTICIVELTLIKQDEEDTRREYTAILLEHMEETTPRNDHSLLDWSEFLPCNLLFKVMLQLMRWGLEIDGLLSRTSIAGDDHLLESGPFEGFELNLLQDCFEIINYRFLHWESLYKFLSDLVRQGSFNQAIDLANKMSDTSLKSGALVEISSELTRQGNVDQALEVSEQIPETYFKEAALCQISRELARRGRVEQVVQVANQIPDTSRHKTKDLVAISGELVGQGFYQQALGVIKKALALANHMSDLQYKVTALNKISGELAKHGNIDQALEVVNQMSDTVEKDMALGAISKGLAKMRSFDQALDVSNQISDSMLNSGALYKIAEEMDRLGLSEQSGYVIENLLESANQTSDTRDKTYYISAVIRLLVRRKSIDQALVVANKMPDTVGKDVTLGEICEELAKSGSFDQAFEILSQISDTNDKRNAVRINLVELAMQDLYQPAINRPLTIQTGLARHQAINRIGRSHFYHYGLSFIKEHVAKLPNEESKLFFLKGITNPLKATKNDILIVIELIKEDKESLKGILYMYALNNIFFEKCTQEKLQMVNRVYDLGWAIDIAGKYLNHKSKPNTSANVQEWIHKTQDEFDREDILRWADKVREGSMSEEIFSERIGRLDVQGGKRP